MRRSQVIVMTSIALTVLSACGSGGSSGGADKGAQVASLATPEASSEAAKAETQRPRERLDMTAEESEAIRVPFNKCLKKAGFTDQKQWKEASDRNTSGTKATSKKQEHENTGYRACEEKYLPLPAWELDPANPEAADFARLVDKCVKKKGVDKLPIEQAMDLYDDCDREAAAELK
jgi:hypothetical protein